MAVLTQLRSVCANCGITDDIIDMPSFVCYPESPTHVTYRARLEGTSQTDSGHFISLIEDWVGGGASVIVAGVLMAVDTECSVAISSLSEPECLRMPSTEPPTIPSPSPITESDQVTDTESPNTAAIIGGVVVAIILIIAITIAIVVIVIVTLVLRSRRGDVSFKNTLEK